MPSLFDFLVNVWFYLSSLIRFCTHSPLENIKGFHFYKCKWWLLVAFEKALRFETLLTACSLFSFAMAIKKHAVLWWCNFSFSPWIWRNALTSNSQSSVATVESSGENQRHFAWFCMGNVDTWIFKEVGRRLNWSVSPGLLRFCRISLNSSWVG